MARCPRYRSKMEFVCVRRSWLCVLVMAPFFACQKPNRQPITLPQSKVLLGSQENRCEDEPACNPHPEVTQVKQPVQGTERLKISKKDKRFPALSVIDCEKVCQRIFQCRLDHPFDTAQMCESACQFAEDDEVTLNNYCCIAESTTCGAARACGKKKHRCRQTD